MGSNITNTYLDEFFVRNLTNGTITLGDLVHLSIPPRKTIDILKVPRVTKDKINQSTDLRTAVRGKFLKIIKPKRKSYNSPVKEAIIADFRDTHKILSKGIIVQVPTASENLPIWQADTQVKLLSIRGFTDAGTVTFNIMLRGSTSPYSGGSAINSGVIVADVNGASQSGFVRTTVKAGQWLTFTTSAMAGATSCHITVSFYSEPPT